MHFKRAVALDGSYGPPLVGLAEAYLVSEHNYSTYQFTEAADLAKNALDRAAAMGFKPSEYYSNLGLFHESLARIDR